MTSNKTYTLTATDAAVVKGMLDRGDRQSDIAAWFGVNSGRIAEINIGKRYTHVPKSLAQDLPPPGPYEVSVRSSVKARETLSALRDIIDQTLNEIADWETAN